MLPLEGVHVLEISHFMAGPAACRDLFELGASVIKIEPPGGEHTRFAHPFTEDGTSYYFATFNFGKRSVALDLRSEEAAEMLPHLIAWTDILVTNYSVGVPERLGFGYDTIRRINPRAIMVHISGFGSWSDYSAFPAYDVTIQAMSGVVSMIGNPDEAPFIVGTALADLVTGQHATSAALAALQLRERTGTGTRVEVSMMRAMTRFLGTPVAIAASGAVVTRYGNRSPRRFVNMYATTDGYIVPSPITTKQWVALCELIGRSDWTTTEITENYPPRYLADDVLRTEVETEVGLWASQRTSREAVKLLLDADVPCGPVLSVADLQNVDQEQNLRLFRDIELPTGEHLTVSASTPEWFDVEPDNRSRRLHAAGEDTADVWAELRPAP